MNHEDKPSTILEKALEDLVRVERSEDFEVNMDHWYDLKDDGVCSVCLAGAAVAGQVNFDQKVFEGMDEEYDNKYFNRFAFLDSVRDYHYESAAFQLKNHNNIILPGTIIVELYKRFGLKDRIEYHHDKTKFHENMGKVVDVLREGGF